MWLDVSSDLFRVFAVGTVTYLTLIAVLRISGKRTLAKLNAFDFVVTVALGSTLATIMLNTNVSWAEGAVALGLLAFLQLAVAWTTVRLPKGRSVVTARATLLLRDGRLQREELRRQRVTEGEIRQAVRATGRGDLSSIAAVVLESDGTISVVPGDQRGNASALCDVGYAER